MDSMLCSHIEINCSGGIASVWQPQKNKKNDYLSINDNSDEKDNNEADEQIKK
jgi:hypothetical protein